ncbi:MAG: OmpA family protein [Pseudomonadaceae bacterium]|nr:OmpA family protein [Pseudomonadaceae bacterium]
MERKIVGGLAVAAMVAGGSLPLAAHAAMMDAVTMQNREYLADLYMLAARSESQDWDIENANYLQGAAVNAVNGGVIAPRDWRAERLTQASPAELEAARAKLQYAIDGGAAQRMPVAFSRALVGYDCWVGQQKAEPNASHNLYSCRDQYYRSAQYLPDVPTTRVVTKQVETIFKELHKVYFALDSAALSDEAKRQLDEARDMLTGATGGKLVISGYTDTTGSRAYNEALSRKRALAVAGYLGLAPEKYEIETHAYGESRLQVPTPDGTLEPRNRVVVVGVRATKEVTVQETVPVRTEHRWY